MRKRKKPTARQIRLHETTHRKAPKPVVNVAVGPSSDDEDSNAITEEEDYLLSPTGTWPIDCGHSGPGFASPVDIIWKRLSSVGVVTLIALASVAFMRLYDSRLMAKNDDHYQAVTGQMGYDNEIPLTPRLNWPVVMVSGGVLISGILAHLRHRNVMMTQREKERIITRRIRYGFLGLLLSFMVIIKITLVLRDTLWAPVLPNPIFSYWLSLNAEVRAVIGLCAFLAVMRLCPRGSSNSINQRSLRQTFGHGYSRRHHAQKHRHRH